MIRSEMAEILRTSPHQQKRYSSYRLTPLLKEGEYIFKPDEPFLIQIPTNGVKPGALEIAVQGAAPTTPERPYSTTPQNP